MFWRHYCIVKSNCFILTTTTVVSLGVPIFKVFTVGPYFEEETSVKQHYVFAHGLCQKLLSVNSVSINLNTQKNLMEQLYLLG